MSRVLRFTLWSVGILAVVLGATLFWVESQLRPEPLGARVKGLLADAKIKGAIARIEASLDGKFSAEGIDLVLSDGTKIVATSIKELSLRTRVSTGQIAALIAEVLAEAGAAANAANDGGAAVDVGSARALDASRAIETVLADTAAALTRVDAVASLATTQVADLRAADVGLGVALASLGEMARAASRQRATAAELEETMRRLRLIAQSVDRALAAQRDKAGGAGAAILEMRNLIADVASSQIDQEDALRRLIEQVDAIAAANAQQRAPLQSLDDALPALKSGALRLSSETQRFLL
jgi:methyl-accepting chemotaxis protein